MTENDVFSWWIAGASITFLICYITMSKDRDKDEGGVNIDRSNGSFKGFSRREKRTGMSDAFFCAAQSAMFWPIILIGLIFNLFN